MLLGLEKSETHKTVMEARLSLKRQTLESSLSGRQGGGREVSKGSHSLEEKTAPELKLAALREWAEGGRQLEVNHFSAVV